MKLLRITGLVLFLLSVTAFTGYAIYKEVSTDTAGPVFEYTGGDMQASINTIKEELLKNVKALDDLDGDVTDTIILEKLSAFTKTGERTLTYTAFDSRNNVTKWERTLKYTDYTPPRFDLSKSLIFTVGEQEDILRYMTAVDCIDGDLTDKIRYEEPENAFGETEKTYQVKFMVTNSAGDTAYLPATVEFCYPNSENKDKIPEIALSSYLIYVKTGGEFDAKSYLNYVKVGEEQSYVQDGRLSKGSEKTLAGEVSVQSKVDINVPGTYEVKYSITSQKGFTGSARLLVIVEE